MLKCRRSDDREKVNKRNVEMPPIGRQQSVLPKVAALEDKYRPMEKKVHAFTPIFMLKLKFYFFF